MHTGNLEVEPLPGDHVVLELLGAELLAGVVLAEQVLDDGTRLPNLEVAVVVVDESGHATIGVDLGVGFTLVLA